MATNDETTNPYFIAINTAKRINRIVGFNFVTPLSVNSLSSDWIMAFFALEGYAEIKAALKEGEEILKKRRREHSSYSLSHKD